MSAIPTGKNPRRVLISPDGQRLYVANGGGNSVSLIEIPNDRVLTTIEKVGQDPGSLAISPDGRYLYVGNHGGDLSIINTTTYTVETILTGGAVRDIALTADGKKLFLAMEWKGLKVLDTDSRQLFNISNIPCPEGLAIPRLGNLLYVSYQCFGPGGRSGHDAIGVFDMTTGQLVDVIKGVPNVGGHIAISPDGTQLWINGNDGCSQPAYDHEGCPYSPSAVVQVIRPDDHALLKSFGFDVADGNGPISFFPHTGQVLIGGGFFAKIVDSANFERTDSLPINGAGNAVFTPDGTRIYVPVYEQNQVVVLGHGKPAPPEVSQKVGTIRSSDVVSHLLKGASPDEMAELMREHAIPLNAPLEEDMRRAGVAEAVIEAVADNMLLQMAKAPLP